MDRRNGPGRVNLGKPVFGGAEDAQPEQPKRKRRRIVDGLVALSSAAIVSVYALGYLHTNAAENQISAQEAAPVPAYTLAQRATSTPTPAPPQATASPDSVTAPSVTATATPQSDAQTAGYKDGTYVGVGSSRHGDIEATVVIKGGKILSASIIRCMTRYPCSDVSPLVREVVTDQGVPVDHVSRATDSSNAFKEAIANAIAQAT